MFSCRWSFGREAHGGHRRGVPEERLIDGVESAAPIVGGRVAPFRGMRDAARGRHAGGRIVPELAVLAGIDIGHKGDSSIRATVLMRVLKKGVFGETYSI